MLTLIHGDNTQASRNYYFEIKQKSTNAKILEGEKIGLTDIIEAIEGDGLFATTQAVFIEQLFSKNRASSEFDSILKYLNSDHKIPITLWEGKEIDKKQIAKLIKAANKQFSYPKTLFQLLDALRPGNGKQLVTLFQQSLQTEEVELLLFMLTKQFRLLLALQSPTNDSIEEVKRIQPWQMSKLQKQAKLFSETQLKYIYSKLYEFDLGYKTGGLSMPLIPTLDFFLAGL
ncbi:MAG TPA: hypothetical protein VMR41_01075 [Patescibacteria group bacterium]|nr:hypothetical protein [Patescibacteria group bacterium]